MHLTMNKNQELALNMEQQKYAPKLAVRWQKREITDTEGNQLLVWFPDMEN